MGNISTLSIACMILAAIICIFGPIIFMIYWKQKSHCSLKSAFFGAFIFFIFAVILESLLHAFVLTPDCLVYNNPVLYVLYGILAAAIFEEGGRYVAFRFLLKNYDTKEDAIMYGIGHGGIEVILLVGFSLISSIILALTINNMGVDQFIESFTPAQISDIHAIIQSLQAFTPLQTLLSLIERISAMILHLSCSVIVYYAVRNKEWRYMLLALGFHALMNLPAALFQAQFISNLVVIEGMTLIIACAIGFYAFNLYNNKTAA